MFLPISIIGYFQLTRFKLIKTAKIFLVFSSIFFYAYWKTDYVFILLFSIAFNFFISNKIKKAYDNCLNKRSKYLLFFGISTDILILGYYKYTDFLITNINNIFNALFSLQLIVLPLAISFFTFQQISYLVDTYRGQVKQHTFLDYVLFIVFFPQLIAGPIVRHNEMMPQFADPSKKTFDWENFCKGMFFIHYWFRKKSANR